jgi:1,4-alpha-glucan branching enzyme/maltooligosyltrehalose trehalohydrolase
MPFGAELLDGGVRFRIWAPAAQRVLLHIEDRAPIEMAAQGGGFFQHVEQNAAAGTRYGFSFDDRAVRVPDPASRYNPDDVHGPSEVIDPDSFEWSDGDWSGRAWREAVIYELHVGAFTPEGTFAAAESRLDYLAELGVTAIELMPVADTPGRRNWGYDGALPFAPESSYGRPEDLKRFIEAAHARELMVFLDVVYNHFGPEGNYLHLYAPQFFTDRHATPWGKAINFDDADSRIVREYFINNALYWLEEYHFDGLRFDAVHAIADDSEPDFVSELATAVQLQTRRTVHLVLENDNNAARYLLRDARGGPLAHTAQWNDDFHHAAHVLLTGETARYYQDYDNAGVRLLRCLLEGFAYQGEPSRHRNGARRGESTAGLPFEAFVNFLQNHDQIGNRAHGERLWMLTAERSLRAAECLLLLLPTPILLFMGDEFHAPNPFPFFSDFSGDLAQAVADGRRREFAEFFAGEHDAAIPDPNDPATFDRAVLDWSALRRAEHSRALGRYRSLLALRREQLVPRLPATRGRGSMLSDTAIEARWTLRDGAVLTVLANLGDTPAAIDTWPRGELLCATDETVRPPWPAAFPPWCAAWYLER